ncbi:MAG: V-type ATPase 116kDa subunit family protein, partial [Dehalococcoidales bacterium]|nr:V-type ATPase 116kDa subunit family protein [Dehalococcoidales bacterium]
ELKKYLEPIAHQSQLRLRDLNFSGGYLFSRVFAFPSEAYQSLHGTLKDYFFESTVATIENETVSYGIGKTEDQKIIESLVTESGGKILQIPDDDITLLEFLKVTEDRIHITQQELAKLHKELQSKTRENMERLVLLREVLSAESERLSVLEKASEARYVTLTEGWIPESNVEPVIFELRDTIKYVFVDTRKPEERENPPTKLRNPGGFKPFQVIVNLFGIPGYREWDPTPIIAYSFALFFGLMVGDVIYALGIILIARFLLRMFTDNPKSEGFKLFQRLFYISGVIALLIGLLSGTYLGDLGESFSGQSLALIEGAKQTLSNPLSFIILSIILGFIHVNTGHLLSLIRGVKEKTKGVLPGKIGLFLLQISGIPYLMHGVLKVNIPLLNEQIYSILTYILLLSIVLIIISSVIQKGAFLGGIFWVFDITGLLGDVMSYCRIAGVGLATFYLAFCFNLLASLLSSIIPGVAGFIIGGIMAVIILILGHTLNLILSGLTGFVHSLRLCFVEFLFKFFEGSGREYSPFKLKIRASVIIGAKS